MSNIHYTTLSQANQYTYHHQQQPINHYHHQHHHHPHKQQQQQALPPQIVSPTGTVSNISTYSNHFSPQVQSTAYFLDRFDLDNYGTQTLRQTVENILSQNKSKGLKVKLSLPDDGLIIDNLTDANQSWIFKTSELLYFWRDPSYLNIIAVITKNRSKNTRPYSASIFRLRGNESAQYFLHQAQKFFSNLSSIKSFHVQTTDKLLRNESESKSSMKTKSLTIVNKPSESTSIRRVTRAEFDPGKMPVLTNHRTLSETASSIDSQMFDSTREIITYGKKSIHDDDEDKLTTISNHISLDQVAELMQELKNLRNEITALKLERKMPISTRSISTSPLVMYSEKVIQTNDLLSPLSRQLLSEVEKDAETQTDFSLISHQRKQITRKNKKTMIGSGGISSIVENRNGHRTISNSSSTTISDQEEGSSDISSQTTHSSSDTISLPQPTILAAPPRPVLIQKPISNEEDLVTTDKEMPTFLSPITSSSSNRFSTGETTTTNENMNPPQEHIYENVPILIQSHTNRDNLYTIPIIKPDESKIIPSDDYVYYTINNSTESQQNSSNSPPTMDNSTTTIDPSQMIIQQQQKPQIVSTGRHRNQPIYFANHLTNPIFNIDKQLLINTIANQFGIDLNSPQLQQLITNQHLFVARKRTFANMIWQMTPDEETALYSSTGHTNQIFIDSNDSNNLTARPILKLTKHFPSKRRSITWDNTLE